MLQVATESASKTRDRNQLDDLLHRPIPQRACSRMATSDLAAVSFVDEQSLTLWRRRWAQLGASSSLARARCRARRGRGGGDGGGLAAAKREVWLIIKLW